MCARARAAAWHAREQWRLSVQEGLLGRSAHAKRGSSAFERTARDAGRMLAERKKGKVHRRVLTKNTGAVGMDVLVGITYHAPRIWVALRVLTRARRAARPHALHLFMEVGVRAPAWGLHNLGTFYGGCLEQRAPLHGTARCTRSLV